MISDYDIFDIPCRVCGNKWGNTNDIDGRPECAVTPTHEYLPNLIEYTVTESRVRGDLGRPIWVSERKWWLETIARHSSDGVCSDFD